MITPYFNQKLHQTLRNMPSSIVSQQAAAARNLQTQWQQSMSVINSNISTLSDQNQNLLEVVKNKGAQLEDFNKTLLAIQSEHTSQKSLYSTMTQCLQKMSQDLDTNQEQINDLAVLAHFHKAKNKSLGQTIESLNTMVEESLKGTNISHEKLLVIAAAVQKFKTQINSSSDKKLEEISQQDELIEELRQLLMNLQN